MDTADILHLKKKFSPLAFKMKSLRAECGGLLGLLVLFLGGEEWVMKHSVKTTIWKIMRALKVESYKD